jgi:hypothetical protein
MPKKYLAIAGVSALLVSLLAAVGLKSNSVETRDQSTQKTIKEIRGISDLSSRIADVRALAWERLAANQNNSYTPKIEIEALIGPNSLDCSKELIKVVQSVEKAFQGVKLPKKLYLLIGNSDLDKKWFENETRRLLDKKFLSFEGKEMINPETVNDQGIGVTWADNPCNSSLDVSKEDGNRVAHGFFHVLQTNQFIGTDKDWGRWGEIPRWILEGGAMLAANYYSHGQTQEGFLKRPENFYELYQLGEDFFPEFMKYIPGEKNPWNHTDKWENFRAYDVGLYICEILFALRGPESIINLYGEYLATNDFDKSFANIYGKTWTDSYPILSKATFDVIKESTRKVMPYLFTEKKAA